MSSHMNLVEIIANPLYSRELNSSNANERCHGLAGHWQRKYWTRSPAQTLWWKASLLYTTHGLPCEGGVHNSENTATKKALLVVVCCSASFQTSSRVQVLPPRRPLLNSFCQRSASAMSIASFQKLLSTCNISCMLQKRLQNERDRGCLYMWHIKLLALFRISTFQAKQSRLIGSGVLIVMVLLKENGGSCLAKFIRGGGCKDNMVGCHYGVMR